MAPENVNPTPCVYGRVYLKMAVSSHDMTNKVLCADGEAVEEEGGSKKRKPGSAEGTGRKKSRVVRGGPAKVLQSEFIRRLRAGAETGDFGGLMLLLREMSPVAVDEQLQLMRVRLASSSIVDPS